MTKTFQANGEWEGILDPKLVVKRLREVADNIEKGSYIVKESSEGSLMTFDDFTMRDLHIAYNAKVGT